MKISEVFASKFLKAADLNGRTVRVKIANVHSEAMNDGQNKPVLYFVGAQKGLVMNRTNSTTLAMVFGDDTDNWIGATIELFPMTVPFQGQMQPAIRVKVPAEDTLPAAPAARPDRIVPNARMRSENPAPPAAFNNDDGGGDIPF
jgi:hypothetical protein